MKKSNKRFLQGEALKGIFESLIKNTTDGKFNSVFQLSNGVSSAILNITNDKEYINQR